MRVLVDGAQVVCTVGYSVCVVDAVHSSAHVDTDFFLVVVDVSFGEENSSFAVGVG